MMKISSLMLIFSVLSFSSISFAQKEKKAERAFALATKLKESSRYEEALLEYQSIEAAFPYSEYAKESKLEIANVYFLMKNYVQAQYQYNYYQELYPRAQNSDYALFRAGLSQYKQMPKAVDRDLSMASDVLKTWRNTLVKYPKTKYTNEILKLQSEIIKLMGQKELYIADFYYKRKKCISAKRRINKLFTQYPSFLEDPKALKVAYECSVKLEDTPAAKKYKSLLEKAKSV